jgi:2-polyprenyl-6-hydroxyphenyl methylase/3-demethylubiquinone-9 3-methyltransferase
VIPEGCEAHAVDLSSSGIRHASATFPGVRFHCLDVTGDLSPIPGFGSFDVVISAEVVEHVYLPRNLAKNAYEALKPGGMAILTTPYHGYLKNLALALTGKLDAHFTALWDCGHIKFWSRRTLTQLLEEAGFRVERFVGVGRVLFLWRSTILVARKPSP